MTAAVAPVAPSAAALAAVPGRHLSRWWLAAGAAAVVVAAGLGLVLGPVGLPLGGVLKELVDHLPFVSVDSGLSTTQAAIVWDIRLPRVVLALLVGSLLSVSGASYQGVFRNPLADPYLLGAAAGAGLGATIGITNHWPGPTIAPLAFVGALVAVVFAYALGAAGGLRSIASLLLAGVAVASFLTAVQTFVQQRNTDVIREVYSWILGRLTTAGWTEVRSVLPYFLVTGVVLLGCRRSLDVLAVGDDEAASLGVQPRRIRLLVVAAATLATAAAVSVSGLIGFVGIIVPHTIRLVAGHSYRSVLPLSILFGAAFLALTDLAARTVISPGELPIGVVTAFFGAPFFIVVLRTSRRTVS